MINAQQYLSGAGAVLWTPKTDYLGNAISNPTPSCLGILQSFSRKHKRELKELFGALNYAVAVMGGKMSTDIDIKLGTVDQFLLNSMIYGQSVTSGSLTGLYIDSLINTSGGTSIPTSPYTITPTPPNSGTWSRDLGVINASTNQRLTRVASSPSSGQYSVSAGVYTFASADNGSGIKVYTNYEYTATVSGATEQTLYASLMGPTVTGTLDIFEPNTNTASWRKWTYTNCVCSDYDDDAKNDDFHTHSLKVKPFMGTGNSIVKLSEYNA